ncbi:MAG: hypothetical protein ACRDYV_22335 [Acidimicrobiia bacterium]
MARNTRYLLSKLIPIPMRSTYGVDDAGKKRRQRARWWQWRGRIYRHRNRFI